MDRRTWLGLSAGALAATGTAAQENGDHAAWVGEALKRMEAVKPGATRKDLMAVFAVQGGLSNRLHRSFAYRDCAYFKVDVEFTPVGDADNKLSEKEEDVIKSVSRPYLQWSVKD